MTNTIYYGDIYTNPPKSAVPGARWDHREYDVLTTDLVTTHILAIGVLPAGHRLLDLKLEVAILDSHTTPTLTITVGLLNNYYGDPDVTVKAGWDKANITPGIAAQVGSASGATTPAEVAEGGSSTVALVTGSDIITASTIGRTTAGVAKLGATATLTPTLSLGVSKKDRIIAVQFPAAAATAVAGKLAVDYCVDQP